MTRSSRTRRHLAGRLAGTARRPPPHGPGHTPSGEDQARGGHRTDQETTMSEATQPLLGPAGRRGIGTAAIAYALLAGVETSTSRTYHRPARHPARSPPTTPPPAPAFTGWIGGLALAAYIVFVAGLVSLIAPARRTRWASLVL